MTTLRFDGTSGADTLAVSLDTLLRTRLLIQANSGGGKSHALRAMLEQTHGKVLQIVLDPEGEFATLRESFGFVLAGKDGDVPAHPKVARVLCRRLLEANASAVIDLYDLTLVERREFVKLFLTELMALPRALWKPTLIVLDEAHLFCPERGSGESQSTESVIALCTQGRKRGFCAVLATQRISKLHKDAAAELLNKLIGRTGLDVDMKRAGDELGMDKDHRMALRTLTPGEFFGYGPALGGEITRVRSRPAITSHPDANSLTAAHAPPSASVLALVAQIGDLPAIAAQEAKTVETLERQVKELQGQLRQVQRGTAAPDPGVTQRAVEDAVRAAMERDRVAVSAVIAEAHEQISDALTRLSLLRHTSAPAIASGERPARSLPDAPSERRMTKTQLPPAVVDRVYPRAGATPISNTMRRMLSVLVQLDALGVEFPEKRTMAGWSGVSHTTGTFSNQLRGLRDAGCIEVQGDRLRITDVGRENAAPSVAISTLSDLHSVWESKFSATVARMFRALLSLSGPRMKPVSKAELAESVGVSHTTGTFSNQLRELRSPGVIEDVDKQSVRLTRLVYPEGLRHG
ncbi:MAG: ATP-binding protein [Gemmatimonadaceae bacterium]|nr:ATP-binding protein [Gemmatimonadaceae bacterium]